MPLPPKAHAPFPCPANQHCHAAPDDTTTRHAATALPPGADPAQSPLGPNPATHPLRINLNAFLKHRAYVQFAVRFPAQPSARPIPPLAGN